MSEHSDQNRSLTTLASKSERVLAVVWPETRLLDVIKDQVLEHEFIPLEQYPSVIQLVADGPIISALNLLHEKLLSSIAKTEKNPTDENVWREDRIIIYCRKRGGWRSGEVYSSGLIAKIENDVVDDDFDPQIEEVGIGFHTHGAHSQIVRFFSLSDLAAPLIMRNKENIDVLPVSEAIVCPGISFFAFATQETPVLSEEEIHKITDVESVKPGMAATTNKLLDQSEDDKSNILKSHVLPRVPSESMFPKYLSEYGVSLTIYSYVLNFIRRHKLVVYSLKDGDMKLVKISEDF